MERHGAITQSLSPRIIIVTKGNQQNHIIYIHLCTGRYSGRQTTIWKVALKSTE